MQTMMTSSSSEQNGILSFPYGCGGISDCGSEMPVSELGYGQTASLDICPYSVMTHRPVSLEFVGVAWAIGVHLLS